MDGFFHADPHPGNLLVKEDGTLAFIDFGMVGQINTSMKDNMVSIVLALFKKDAGGVVNAFRNLGFIKEGVDSNPITKSVDLMIRRFYDDDMSNIDLEELSAELRELMYSQPFQLPAQTTFLGKSLLTLTGICYGLDADFDLMKVSTPYVNKLLPETLGDDSQDGNIGVILDQVKSIALDVIALPEKLNRMVTGLETGELRFRPAKTFENNLYEHQTYLVNRIIKAILISGIGIIGAIFYNGQSPQIGLALLALSGFLVLTVARGKRTRGTRSRSRRRGAGSGFKKPRLHP